jgi:hypothetical protein
MAELGEALLGGLAGGVDVDDATAAASSVDDDESLMSQAARGSTHAFEALARRYYRESLIPLRQAQSLEFFIFASHSCLSPSKT